MVTRARLGCLGWTLLLTTVGGCDKLPFGGDDKDDTQDRAAEDDGDDAKHKAEIEAAKVAAVEDYKRKSEAEIEARIAAATQKALDEQRKSFESTATATATQVDKSKRPVWLSDLAVGEPRSYGGASGTMPITALAEIRQKIEPNTYVHVKATCKEGTHVFADATSLNPDYSKPLDTRSIGDKAEVKGNLFSYGLDHRLAPCKLDFKLGGTGTGGLSVDLGEGCWDGKEATLSPCVPPIAAVPASGAAAPVEVLSVAHVASSGYGSHGLKFNYAMLFHETHNPKRRLTFKSACHVGKSIVEVDQAHFMSGPFKLEAGEVMARTASLYWSSTVGFTSTPKLCDLTASLWTLKPGSYSDYDEAILYEACFRGSAIDKGRCDGGSVTRSSTFGAMTAANVKLDGVALKLEEKYGTTDKFSLSLRADVTVSEQIKNDQGVAGSVTCKVGKNKLVDKSNLYGLDMQYLLPGETAKVSTSAFSGSPLEAPKWCQVDFTGGARYSAKSTPVPLGSYCLKKGVVKAGKC